MKLLTAILLTFITVTAFALPQTVKLTGAFVSKDGYKSDVTVELKMKKQSADKTRYKGQMTFIGQVLNQTQSIDLTINTKKNKSEGVVNTYDGYIAFDKKMAFALTVGESVQLEYSEYQNDHNSDFCNPINNNFCRPGNNLPRFVGSGVLNLNVIDAQ